VTSNEADIAYVIGREYQSRGHATDAVRTMLAFIEEAIGVPTEHAPVDARNGPSRRLLERFRFTLANGEDARNLRFKRTLRAGAEPGPKLFESRATNPDDVHRRPARFAGSVDDRSRPNRRPVE
jgi:hypothetical protein